MRISRAKYDTLVRQRDEAQKLAYTYNTSYQHTYNKWREAQAALDIARKHTCEPRDPFVRLWEFPTNQGAADARDAMISLLVQAGVKFEVELRDCLWRVKAMF